MIPESVHYERVVVLLTSKVQDLEYDKQALQQKVDDLESRLAAIEAMLANQ